MQATLDTEVRKLQPTELYTLSNILNQSDSWKKLMAIVPKPDSEECMFNNDHFLMIEQAIRQQQRSGAEIFLSEWSTLNKKRPTCRSMLDLLVKAQLFRAADYLAVDILKSQPPERPQFGPAAAIDVSDKALEELLRQQVADLRTESSELPGESPLMWSLHFAEGKIGKVKENAVEPSDLMKFSEDKSDLMKFSGPVRESKHSTEVSDLMKFSDKVPDADNYVLQEAQSADIPLCVRENAFKSSASDPSASVDLTSATSVESTDSIITSTSSEKMSLPNISQNVIPIVVLEYNDKEKN